MNNNTLAEYADGIKLPNTEPKLHTLDFHDWSCDNEDELTCIFAESGADRELDFDRETQEESMYHLRSVAAKTYPQLIWEDKL